MKRTDPKCEYRIVRGGIWEQNDFERKVSALMNEGWRPTGGVFMRDGPAVYFYQAMQRITP
jgi:hypothetical protein